MTFACRMFGHQRSRTYAVFDEDRWKSYCRRCGAKMERRNGQWKTLEAGAAPEPAESPGP